MFQETKVDYGINNHKAYTDKCRSSSIHFWLLARNISLLQSIYECYLCGSTHTVDLKEAIKTPLGE